VARWLIDKAGVQITVKTRSDSVAELLAGTFGSMGAEPVRSSRGIEISVKRQDGHWHLRDHSNDLQRKIHEPGDLIYHLTDRIVFHVADRANETHCLHAAAVASNANALVIPASSGDGKSSLTTWLVANGFAYITDELILVNEAQQIHGIARPIQIKSHGVDAIEHLLDKPTMMRKGKYANALPVEALGGTVSEQQLHNLRLFIFPHYKDQSGYSFAQLSSADAGMRLMANHVNARNLEGHGFREMMAIIRRTPCYSLEYGGFDSLPANFAAQLRDLLGGSA